MKLKGKIIGHTLILLMLLGGSILSVVYFNVQGFILNQINSQLQTNISLGYDLLDKYYPGEWEVRGDTLYKGSKLINGDVFFVDKFKELTNAPAIIYINDTSIATNLLKTDGSRAIGAKVSEQVANVVLKEGKEFSGTATVVDTSYQTKYVPIKDSNGKVIGIWFTGMPSSMVTKDVNSLALKILLITLIALGLGIILSILFARKMTQSVKIVLKSLKHIAAGDLTQPCLVNSKDEIKDIALGLNAMQESLSKVVGKVQVSSRNTEDISVNLSATSEEMFGAINEVTRAIQHIASGTGSQANKLSQSKEQFDRLSRELEEITQFLTTVQRDSEEIGLNANQSSQDVNVLLSSLNQTNVSIEEFIKQVTQLTYRTQQISQITLVLDQISEQTNLLALNASIEAARAGDVGRGFSVVADEVRKLAEQSKNSSQNIVSLVQEILQDTRGIEDISRIVQKEQQEQLDVTNKTILSFQGIVNQVNAIIPEVERLSQTTQRINLDHNELLQNFNSISVLADEISASSQEIVTSSEEVSASSDEVVSVVSKLSGMASELKTMVAQFKIGKD